MPLTYRGIGVHISCDGQELSQYAPEITEGQKLAQCHIASEAGKLFKIVIENLDRQQIVTPKVVKIILDGYEARCSLLDGKRTVFVMDKIIVSPTKSRLFQFASVETHDSEEGLVDTANIEKLGTIEVILCRAFRDQSKPEMIATGGPIPTTASVPERAKKAGWHRVAFGTEAPIEPVKYVTTHWIDSLSSPFAVFRFHYQPQELLQARGIIPRVPVPAPVQLAKVPPTAPRALSNIVGQKRPAPMEGLEGRDTKRGILQAHWQTPERPRPSSTKTVARVKAEPADSPDRTADALRVLRDSIQAARDTMLAAQAQLERLERRQSSRALEYRPSPIRVGSARGQTIDLTLDD
ncbi:hypothetical protein DENSPDRAFT_682278 [Dentipellis sp. KUC8613]|nr:hypothetical protein DENSPDRAFT_682278 [Dentipellis sp. KUC8613]